MRIDMSKLDHWLLWNAKYTQEERETVIETLWEYHYERKRKRLARWQKRKLKRLFGG